MPSGCRMWAWRSSSSEAAAHEALPKCKVIVNVFGHTVNEYIGVIDRLNDAEGIAAYELNVSCPNVHAGGMAFGADPCALEDLVDRTKRVANRPLIVKLSPNVTSMAHMARVCAEAGADAVSLVNTFLAMSIDAEERRPRLSNVTGGLSGPAIKPIALRMVYEVGARGQDSRDRHGWNCDGRRCGGVSAGRRDGGAGGHGKLRRSASNGKAGTRAGVVVQEPRYSEGDKPYGGIGSSAGCK